MGLSTWVVVCVAVGGALGAMGRLLADRAALRWTPQVAELGVLVANVVASFLLGWLGAGEVLLGSVPGRAPTAPTFMGGPVLGIDWWLAGAGLAGALSTWSTAAVQVARRWREGQHRAAVVLGLATWLLAAGAARVGAMASLALV